MDDDASVEKYITYEDYLDAQITAHDRKYLEDDELARQLVHLELMLTFLSLFLSHLYLNYCFCLQLPWKFGTWAW